MRLRDRPVFSFQGHPEAGPGPHDAACIFDDFVASFRSSQEKRIHG
jgi:carbamoyl-phosphate synthase small subunit